MQVKKVQESGDVLKFSPARRFHMSITIRKGVREEKTHFISSVEVTFLSLMISSERGMTISSPQDIYHLAIGYVLAENLVPTYADIESFGCRRRKGSR